MGAERRKAMKSVSVKAPVAEDIAGEKQQRIYYLDWLKMLAIAGVFLIHSGNMFDMLYKPVSNSKHTTSSVVTTLAASDSFASGGMYFLNFLPQWGMALFFLLSGAGTWYALRHRSSRQFIKERLLRLLIPLIIGVIVIAPLQAYFEALSNSLFNGNVFQFYPYFLGHIHPVLSPQWPGAVTHHLWFLVDLFVFSLVTLPVCLFLKHSSGQKFVQLLARMCERPGGLLLLFLPIALIQVALRASFPGYQNWADVCCWLICYMYGYIIFSNARFGEAIQRQGKLALYLGIGGFLAMIALWCAGLLGTWANTPDYSVGCLLFQVLAGWNTWCWLIVILYAGNKYLNFKNDLLNYGGVASFPFYLLHFPVVVVVAYCVLPWHMNIIAAFVCISACAFLGTLALTDLLFMRLRGVRLVFGSKGAHARFVAERCFAALSMTVIWFGSKGRLLDLQQGIAGLHMQVAKLGKIHREAPWRVRTRALTGTLM
jgi:glucan biosynthesis protein C